LKQRSDARLSLLIPGGIDESFGNKSVRFLGVRILKGSKQFIQQSFGFGYQFALSTFSGFDRNAIGRGAAVDILAGDGFVCRAEVVDEMSPGHALVIRGDRNPRIATPDMKEVLAVYPSRASRASVRAQGVTTRALLEAELPGEVRTWLIRSRHNCPDMSTAFGITSFADEDSDGEADIAVISGLSADGERVSSVVIMRRVGVWSVGKRLLPA